MLVFQRINSLEGCYATTTPTMLRRFTIEEMNLRTFKLGFFLTHFLSVTSRKNQHNSLRSGVNYVGFSKNQQLGRLLCYHYTNDEIHHYDRITTIEEMNLRTFKLGFFLTHFLSVTSRKNQS